MERKRHLLGMTAAEIEEFVAKLGEPRYRADQIRTGIRRHRLSGIEEISDLPKRFRELLGSVSEVRTLRLKDRFLSSDGTRRYLFETAQGDPVETVFIPTENRDTICFSSQSGCPLKCDFCLTAKLGLRSNLEPGEIVEQIVVVLNDVYGERSAPEHGTNLVAMGAGEPFLNFENLLKALAILSEEDGLGISMKRVTVSTAGIVPRILEFAELEQRPNLAISLTAANDELRDRLMPINKKWDIASLMDAAKRFESSLRKGESFTFEYVLLRGVNDSPGHALELANLVKRSGLQKMKVNLIPHNPADPLPYLPTPPEAVAAFKAELESEGVRAYVRTPRGRDIFAACGQLAARDTALAAEDAGA